MSRSKEKRRAYLDNQPSVGFESAVSKTDYGMDNFSFDPDDVDPWRMPKNAAAAPLSRILRSTVDEWSHAGAAVASGLRRVKDLDDDIVRRAQPYSSHPHAIGTVSRQPAEALPIRPGDIVPNFFNNSKSEMAELESGTEEMPTEPLIRLQPLPLRLNADRFADNPGQPPPFTPVNTPMRGISPHLAYRPKNASKLRNNSPESSALTEHEDKEQMSTNTSISSSPRTKALDEKSGNTAFAEEAVKVFDSTAYETYQRVHASERMHLVVTAVPRLKGLTFLIHSMLREIAIKEQEYGKPPYKLIENLTPFTNWWTGYAVQRVSQYEKFVKKLNPPQLHRALGQAE